MVIISYIIYARNQIFALRAAKLDFRQMSLNNFYCEINYFLFLNTALNKYIDEEKCMMSNKMDDFSFESKTVRAIIPDFEYIKQSCVKKTLTALYSRFICRQVQN